MKVENGVVVKLDFVLNDEDGTELDTQAGFEYIAGMNEFIPALEERVIGLSEGDSFEATLPPELHFGQPNPEHQITISKEDFGQESDAEVGGVYEFDDEDGHPFMATVTAIEGDQVSIDCNHPWCGKNLTFKVDVVGVRQPTADELAHGHIHGEGCNH